MDIRTTALLHTLNCVVAALITTHPNAKAFDEAFTFHLEQTFGTLAEDSQVRGQIQVWARTFRLHIPSEGPATPPPAPTD